MKIHVGKLSPQVTFKTIQLRRGLACENIANLVVDLETRSQKLEAYLGVHGVVMMESILVGITYKNEVWRFFSETEAKDLTNRLIKKRRIAYLVNKSWAKTDTN